MTVTNAETDRHKVSPTLHKDLGASGALSEEVVIIDLENTAHAKPVQGIHHQYRFRIDHETHVIGTGTPTGAQLLALAGKSASEWCLFQLLRGNVEEHVELSDTVDLLGRSIERFETKRAWQLCIEGHNFPWCREAITTSEIIKLGGWDTSQGVIEVDEDQNERTLAPDEVIHLKPGKEYGKRHRWKRGAA